jgi:membrane-associated phospholipid phosphatase
MVVVRGALSRRAVRPPLGPHRTSCVTLCLTLLLIACTPLGLPPARDVRLAPASRRFWAAGALALAGAAADDRGLRRTLGGRGGPALASTARTVEPLGRARSALLGLGASFIVGHVAGAPSWAHATARVAAGYVAGDAVTGALKPLVGRARPMVGAGPASFRPLAGDESHHAFPSGHATHAFALAAGVAAESRRPWAAVAAYGLAALVGWSRVHDDAHWSSDVAAGALVGTTAGLTTVQWLRR